MKNLSILIFICMNAIVYGQSNINATDIDSYTTVSNHEDLLFLNEELEQVQIVGIGESTHGTREFNLIYWKMFQYLVEVHNFNTLFLEDEFLACASGTY